jgi:hypothetical protein
VVENALEKIVSAPKEKPRLELIILSRLSCEASSEFTSSWERGSFLQRPGPVMMPHEGSGAALRGFVALISARARHTIVRVAEKAAYTPPTLSGERRQIPNGEDIVE